MPLRIPNAAPTLCIRRDAYERSGLTRDDLDVRLGLTAEDFRVEQGLVVIGPIYSDSLDELFTDLETRGLRYFDDYFELSGNWPDWLLVYATAN